MMKNLSVALLTVSLALPGLTQASWQSDKTQLNDEMSALMQVNRDTEVLMTIDEYEGYDTVEIDRYVTEYYKEIYISHEQAKRLNLVKKAHFYVQESGSIASLNHKLVKRVDEHNPTYFSVDLYRRVVGQSGHYHYVAHVVEYGAI